MSVVGAGLGRKRLLPFLPCLLYHFCPSVPSQHYCMTELMCNLFPFQKAVIPIVIFPLPTFYSSLAEKERRKKCCIIPWASLKSSWREGEEEGEKWEVACCRTFFPPPPPLLPPPSTKFQPPPSLLSLPPPPPISKVSHRSGVKIHPFSNIYFFI